MNNKWCIYIVGHNKIHDETVKVDKDFNNENYVFLNVGQKEKLDNSDDYSVINQRDLSGFIEIGKWWAESEGLYNLWRSGAHKDLDFIGCIHYDMQLKLESKYHINRTNITSRVNKYLKNRERGHISFATYDSQEVYNQKSIIDERYIDKTAGEGDNAIDVIISDYNKFWGTDYKLDDFIKRKRVNLCSSFLIDSIGFDRMMSFFDWLIKSEKLEKFDPDRKYRYQGGKAERYFCVFLAFEYAELLDLNLIHMYDAGWK